LMAVSAGGRLTCVSAAKRAGLWVPVSGHIHISVAPNASRFEAAGAIVHWSTGPLSTRPRTCEQPLINSLFHVAQCLPRTDALAVWESALNKRLVDGGALQRISWGSAAARDLAHAASVLSDSGLESFMATRLSSFGFSVRQQVWVDGHPLDVLVGDRLAIQIDGATHLEQRQRRKDIRGDARLVLLGYTVLRFDYQQVLFDWDYVESTILTAVAQGRHRAT
jgi:very-short-patch-repair endonuclease